MRKVKITTDCVHNGEHTPAGTELNLDIVSAQRLLDAGVAIEIKPSKVVNHNAVETREPEVEDRDPAPARKKGKQATPAADEAPAESSD